MLIFKIRTKKQVWIAISVVLFVNIVVASIFSYMFLRVKNSRDQNRELVRTIEDLTTQKETLQSIKKNISETAQLRSKADRYFVSQDGVVEFLNLLHLLGTENNLVSKVVSVGVEPASVSPELLERIRTNVEVYGTWSDVYHFATLLELLPFKVSISRFAIEKFTDSNRPGLVQAPKNISVDLRRWRGSFDLTVLKIK